MGRCMGSCGSLSHATFVTRAHYGGDRNRRALALALGRTDLLRSPLGCAYIHSQGGGSSVCPDDSFELPLADRRGRLLLERLGGIVVAQKRLDHIEWHAEHDGWQRNLLSIRCLLLGRLDETYLLALGASCRKAPPSLVSAGHALAHDKRRRADFGGAASLASRRGRMRVAASLYGWEKPRTPAPSSRCGNWGFSLFLLI